MDIDNEGLPGSGRRIGKWTAEEEEFAARLADLFLAGQLFLDRADGRTLRTFLASRLNCDPMRISKKYSSVEGLGLRYKQVEFNRKVHDLHMEYLKPFEKAYRDKDIIVQTRRKIRQKYRRSNKSEKSQIEPDNDEKEEKGNESSSESELIAAADEEDFEDERAMSECLKSIDNMKDTYVIYSDDECSTSSSLAHASRSVRPKLSHTFHNSNPDTHDSPIPSFPLLSAGKSSKEKGNKTKTRLYQAKPNQCSDFSTFESFSAHRRLPFVSSCSSESDSSTVTSEPTVANNMVYNSITLLLNAAVEISSEYDITAFDHS
eukprot:CAMPEP_0182437398 /NCGR_PEP_ID=MMETSP1167-20130531/85015_1 /TAXON_ID=2988 /ORGANISM="Mallomonas Sp, Strain CCMP3275" /LENGTH=317 /DNA_ID=CAMNT_0024630299 /DNA_START=477 /DNA_END=1430 /DNA_ORIENTATION=-